MKISYLRIFLSALFLFLVYYQGIGQETDVVQKKTADSIEVDYQLAEINYTRLLIIIRMAILIQLYEHLTGRFQ